ncbi:hypothetical protein B0J12DRAFT_582106 [Macrophomina phaseolina]|uniref:Rhodopsin domain-containing protein n=1 Tax=Macrophomina phaseolina TaxID=35725 RepID=A0ABQ8FYS8_9PEZI|nr:hypothetical protein B0J12DRAFT_582106 [Macrophomina phaseolina]
MVWTNALIGEPPPGLDLTGSRTATNNAIGIVLFALATAAMGLRLLARLRFQNVGLDWDDYLMGLGWILCAGNLACCIAGGFYGLGKHIWTLSPYYMEKITVITFAYVFIYAYSVSVIKYSFIMFYRRIFGLNWFGWFCIGLTTAYLIVYHIVLPLYCDPLKYYWQQWSSPGTGKCPVHEGYFYLGTGIINLLGDIFILSIPIPDIWKLQLTKREKAAIYLIFLLGGFVCIASIIRIKVIWALTQTMDISWAKSDVFIWSSAEPSVAVISGCLPTLRPMFMKILGRYLGGSSNNSDPTQLSEPSALETISKKRTRPIKKPHTGLTTFGDSQIGTQLGTNVDVEGEALEMNKSSTKHRVFGRLSGSNGENLKLREDDEVQLTSIAEAKAYDGSSASLWTLETGQSGEYENRSGGIVVKQTFEWGEEIEQDPRKRTSESGHRL